MIVKDFREKFYEIIDGESFLFPSDTICENLTTGKLLIPLHDYVSKNKLGFIFMHLVFKLPDGNTVIPNLIFIGSYKEKLLETNPDDTFQGVPDMVVEIFSRSTMKRDMTIKKDIYGVPDMVVEILSRSTKKRDITIKKDTYERNGVREYWIIDPWIKSVAVYLLRDGKYFLDDEYILFGENEFEKLNDAEKADVKHEVPVAVLDGLKIPLKYIFKWGYR